MAIMNPIIPPVSKELLLAELTNDKLLRKSNFGNTEIYVFSYKNSPNLMDEVGRLREMTFRMAGGGTGKSKDIVLDDPGEKLATTHLFDFSEEFLKDYLPYTIELGRSFVQPKYQYGRNARKGMFALDNLWDGLGALIIEYPEMKYFFGKVTMYKHFHLSARNYVLSFLNLYFPDKTKLVVPQDPLEFDYERIKEMFFGDNYDADYKKLNAMVRKVGEKIPPLVNAYMNLSPSMITFGTVENHAFGGVEETGILINIADIYNSKKDRHIKSYKRLMKMTQVFPRNPKRLNLAQWSLKRKSNRDN